jgi:hypothetical protein
MECATVKKKEEKCNCHITTYKGNGKKCGFHVTVGRNEPSAGTVTLQPKGGKYSYHVTVKKETGIIFKGKEVRLSFHCKVKGDKCG